MMPTLPVSFFFLDDWCLFVLLVLVLVLVSRLRLVLRLVSGVFLNGPKLYVFVSFWYVACWSVRYKPPTSNEMMVGCRML